MAKLVMEGEPSTLLERMFAPLFRKDPSYNNQYPSFIKDLSPETRLKYDDYINFIKSNEERKSAYKEYENMDTDLISSALDLFADDATQINLDDGESFYVECDDPEVKQLLEDLYFKTLHLDDHIWDIVRTVAKYGDFFVRVVGDESSGVKYCDYSIHPSRVVRIDYQGEIKNFIIDDKVTFNPWDLVHFKLPGATQFTKEAEVKKAETKQDLNTAISTSTYGLSSIAKARKVWKQLQLLEDSVVLSRLSRSFKRNIFMVNTAGMGETAAFDLVDKIASLLKRNKAVNSGKGVESYSGLMNPEEDIVIPVNSDKGNVTVQELGGDVDIQHIVDVDYMNNKLFAALKVPKAYLGFEEALNGRNTLRMLDVRYARTIKNLHRVLILGLERIGRIHLSLLGKDPFLVDFSITLPYISTIEEAEKTEALSNKLDALTKVVSLFDQMDTKGDLVNKKALVTYILNSLDISDSDISSILSLSDQSE